MREFIRTNHQFIILCFLWIAVGVIAGSIPAIVFIFLSVILLKRKDLYQELFLGFLVILILSDSRIEELKFASDVKIFYILLLSVFFFFDRKKFTSFNNLIFLFTPFFIVSLFLVVFAENWLVSFQKYLSYLLLLFIAPNYLIMIYQKDGVGFLKNIVFLFSFVLLIGLLLKYISPDIAMLAGRYRGIFGNPNGVGLFCSMFFLLFYVVKEYFPSLFTKGEYLYVYSTIITSIIFCGSRTAIMSTICFLIFTKLYKVSPFLGFIILCVIIIGYELILNNLSNIINSVGLSEYFRLETLETGSGRNVAWTFAWQQIQDNFFFGKGFFISVNRG